MLTGKTLLIIGGDARYIEMMRTFIEKDATVYAVGFDEKEEQLENVYLTDLINVPKDQLDAVVLPITGLDQDGYAESYFTDESPRISTEWLHSLPEQCEIFTGIMTPFLKQQADLSEKIIPLFDRDDVAIYNSIPTAEGTLMFSIQHTDFTIHNSNVTILGFGRVGKSLVHVFKGLGANVSVYSRNEVELSRIYEYHAKPIHEDDLHYAMGDCDILINTIPALVVTPSIISALPKESLIIDIASKPGGVDFRFAKKRGINAILAPSLPGLVAPKTAGKILAGVIQNIINGKS
ncbi:dipicolinic acid synthetase subunit A [Bacillaceae bacterium W0354]